MHSPLGPLWHRYVEDFTALSWIQKHQLTRSTPRELYGVALYVAISNILGGPTDISPANYVEFYCQSFMMLIGSSLWACTRHAARRVARCVVRRIASLVEHRVPACPALCTATDLAVPRREAPHGHE